MSHQKSRIRFARFLFLARVVSEITVFIGMLIILYIILKQVV